jgi:hypothetical protein
MGPGQVPIDANASSEPGPELGHHGRAASRNIPLMRHSAALTLKRQHNSQPEPRLQAIANHLEELIANHVEELTANLLLCLPVALARALAGKEEAWEGLGLLSGSTIIHVNSLTSFCQLYGSDGWPALLRQELRDQTDEDIEWLSSFGGDGTV